MRNLRNIFQSAKKLGGLSCIFALGSATMALLGLVELAVVFSFCSFTLLVVMLYAVERRRQAGQRRLVVSIERLSTELAKAAEEIKNERQQHTKSLGLVFRELRTVKSAITGDDSVIALRNEQQLATYLRAISANTNVLLDTMAKQNMATVDGDVV